MGWIRRNLHWVLLVAFLLSAAGAVGLGVIGVLASLTAAATAPGVFVPLVETLIPFVLPALLLAALSIAFLVGTVVTAARRVSVPRPSLPRPELPRSDRLVRTGEQLERRLPFLRPLDLPGRFEPTPEQRRERLKERYVNGEIDEVEFERRLSEVVDEEEGSADPGGNRDPGVGRASGRSARDDGGRRNDDRDRSTGGTSIEID